LKINLKKLKKVFKRHSRRPKIYHLAGDHSRNLRQKMKMHRDIRARKRAEYLASLPKNPLKRILYRLHPKRVFGFFTSRHGVLLMLKIIGVIFAVLVIFILAIFAYYRKDLPKNITDLKTCSEGASTLYYDRTGQTLLWASSGDVECTPVALEQISPYLKNAVVAAEDKDFYKHGGFSITGFIRAGWNNLLGKSTQGGSTITQQFVKNSLLTQERSVERKLKELILSIELERTYSKDTILNAYLNEIPLGSVYYGAEAASRGYFGKPSKDLTLDESAMLAAIIPRPTYYLPNGSHTKELSDRKNYVLDLMQQQGYITEKERDDAKVVDTLTKVIPVNTKYSSIIAPHFVLEVQEQLEEEYGATNILKAGFKVTTTLDLTQQRYAEEAVANNIWRVDSDGGDNAALVSEDVATGQVLAEVGSRDFYNPDFGELNMAVTPRSPGSSFKPYDYAALISKTQNWGAGSTIYDLVTDFGWGYIPKDYDFKEPGALAVRYALGGSRNIPAIKAMYITGVENTLALAHKIGIVSGTSCEPSCGLSSAIGDGSEIRLDEHVNGFATFSRMGVYKPQTYVLKVEDSHGKVLKEWKDSAGEQVLDPQVAYIINNMLSDDNARYIRGSSNFNLPGITTALKTGTTNNMDNGWLMMYSTKIAAGVWIGNHENTVVWCGQQGCMEGKTGPMLAEYMKKAHQGLAGSDARWQQPSGIKTVCIDRVSGYAVTTGGECDIFPSWYIPQFPDTTKKATIDIISNKLATACTPSAAQKEITGGGILPELPTTDTYYNNWLTPVMARYGASVGGAIPTATDDIHTCNDADLPQVSIVEPIADFDPLLHGYPIKVQVTQGKYPLTTINLKVGGTIITGGSKSVIASGTYNFVYEYEGSEQFTVTAEVIDSVLYSNSSNPVDVTP
jgi:membrane peptidoglycan carboxypeptidase